LGLALDIAPYSHQLLQAKQQAGERVSLHFYAMWCPTCRAQAKVFKTFQGDASVRDHLPDAWLRVTTLY